MSILDLFNVLEDWQEFPQRLVSSPDKAISQAKLALSGKSALSDALKMIRAEITIFRQVWRSVNFKVIKVANREADVSQAKFRRLGTELHQLAFLIQLNLNQYPEARCQLMNAVACDPNNRDTAFFFVQYYERTGDLQAAYDQLDKTFGGYERFDHFFQLFGLCLNIEKTDATAAVRFFEKLASKKEARIFGKLAQARMDLVQKKENPLALIGDATLLETGKNVLSAKQYEHAYQLFFELISRHPFTGMYWYLTGEALSSIAFTNTISMTAEGQEVFFEKSVVRKEQLLDTIQTMETTLYFEPSLAAAYEVLVNCYLQLHDFSKAVHYARNATIEVPDNVDLRGLYALTLCYDLDFIKAEEVATEVLALSPENEFALSTLNTLRKTPFK